MTKHDCDLKSVLVIGAGSGLGQRIALDFAKSDYYVHLSGRNEENLNKTLREIETTGGKGQSIAADIRNENEVYAAIEKVLRITPTLDVAINCAGVVRPGPVDEMSAEDFALMLQTNLVGVWYCMKHQLKQMKSQKYGSIINISANIGIHTIRPGMAGYGASKAALTVLTRTAALEALPFNVRVHAISPGPLDTALSYRKGEDQTARDERISKTNPSKRIGSLEEVSATALWLCESPAYLVGQDIIIDGGASI